MVNERNLNGRVRFLPPRKDIEFYYAAADMYAGPSLEDTGPLPPVEAMACGVPAILSASCGTAEIITDGVNGLILRRSNGRRVPGGNDSPALRRSGISRTAWRKCRREGARVYLGA